jgi:hypothetical protein
MRNSTIISKQKQCKNGIRRNKKIKGTGIAT